MKNLIKLSLIAGCTIPAVSHGLTLGVTDPATGPFVDLVNLMAADVQTLFQGNGGFGGSAGAYTQMFFETDETTFGNWHTNDNGPIDFGTLGSGLLFQQVANFSSFIFTGSIEIGFLGNESWDRNLLTLQITNGIDTAEEELFSYRRGGIAPNVATTSGLDAGSPNTLIVTPGETPVEGTFFHYNRPATANVVAPQGNPLKFKMFRLVNEDNTFGDAYIIAIDDRMRDLVDFDDGFFYVTGDLTPVPEPSLIAGLAVFGLGIIVIARRKLRSAKK